MKCCMILRYVAHEITLWELGKPGSKAQKRQDFSLFQHWASYSFLVVKWPGYEIDRQPPSNAEAKNEPLHFYPYSFMAWTGTTLLFLWNYTVNIKHIKKNDGQHAGHVWPTLPKNSKC